ncbi:unnamed protein product, partial [Prorocentrum cordatum]
TSEPSFRVSVRVVAASIPGLAAPGVLSHRPFLEASLGESRKATEFADFAREPEGAAWRECPWRFSDTLTFRARAADVAGPGVKISLKARRDVVLGPVQLEMQSADIGEGVVDLRGQALPACGWGEATCPSEWASPVLLVPLVHVRGGICGAEAGLGEKVAHLAVVVSVDADPEEVLLAAARAGGGGRARGAGGGALGRGLAAAAARLEERVSTAIEWLDKPVDVGGLVAPVDAAVPRHPSFEGEAR